MTSDSPRFGHLREWVELVKFEHTLFALPFALTGLLLGGGWPPVLATVGWVLLALVGGRTFAMALNRVIDAPLDARNPRTATRAIPAGRIRASAALALAAAALALLIAATWQLPLICQQLLPLAVLVLAGYSYTKRFTWASHLVLGAALGAAAAGGWLAAAGRIEPGAWWLAAAVVSWVAGFDIIYACQDVAFDREVGLHSIPARLGLAGGLRVSRALHAVTVACLVALGAVHGVGPFFWSGVALVAALLVYEHRLVSADDLSRVDAAFFALNGWVSVGFFGFTLMDRLYI